MRKVKKVLEYHFDAGRKVGPNCHVRIDRNHYSAPERHIGRKVHARVGERMVELFLDKGGERIAVHRLKSGRNQYPTTPEHMPDAAPQPPEIVSISR